MATIIPFRAIRPPRHLAHLVASRAYANYSQQDLSQKLRSNPFSFLHIINPDAETTSETMHEKMSMKQRFKMVKEKFEEFCGNGYLIQDETESIYIYRQTSEHGCFTGFIAGISTDDYDSGVIKKHEATLLERERIFEEYLHITGFNAEPVLLTYPRNPILNDVIKEQTQPRPEYEFTTTDGILHEFWKVNSLEVTEKIAAIFKKFDSIYIADGHHRCASSALLAKHHNQTGYRYCMAYFIPEDNLCILPFHRIIRSIGEINADAIVNQLLKYFTVTPLQSPALPGRHGELTMCIKGQWYLLLGKPESGIFSNPIILDAQIVTDVILNPIFGIEDLRTDKRITFEGGKVDPGDIHQKIVSGQADAAIMLFPVSLQQLTAIADSGAVMPPKSTWIEPKLRSGLAIYSFSG
jgi:uncharacterized protein (DUF1015 family)